MKTNIYFRPDTESLEVSLEGESEAEIAFLCWLRCTAPEWGEAASPDISVRLTFRRSEASAALFQYIQGVGLSEIGTHNLVVHEGN